MLETSGDEIVTALGDVVSEVDRERWTASSASSSPERSRIRCRPACGAGSTTTGRSSATGASISGRHRAPLSCGTAGRTEFVPIAHGEWLAAKLGADAHLRPDHGHLSLSLEPYGEILDALLDDSSGAGD